MDPDATCTAATAQPPNADEVKWLRFMREEEKLARDVYLKLFDTWKLTVFSRIARSEQRHLQWEIC